MASFIRAIQLAHLNGWYFYVSQIAIDSVDKKKVEWNWIEAVLREQCPNFPCGVYTRNHEYVVVSKNLMFKVNGRHFRLKVHFKLFEDDLPRIQNVYVIDV